MWSETGPRTRFWRVWGMEIIHQNALRDSDRVVPILQVTTRALALNSMPFAHILPGVFFSVCLTDLSAATVYDGGQGRGRTDDEQATWHTFPKKGFPLSLVVPAMYQADFYSFTMGNPAIRDPRFLLCLHVLHTELTGKPKPTRPRRRGYVDCAKGAPLSRPPGAMERSKRVPSSSQTAKQPGFPPTSHPQHGCPSLVLLILQLLLLRLVFVGVSKDVGEHPEGSGDPGGDADAESNKGRQGVHKNEHAWAAGNGGLFRIEVRTYEAKLEMERRDEEATVVCAKRLTADAQAKW